MIDKLDKINSKKIFCKIKENLFRCDLYYVKYSDERGYYLDIEKIELQQSNENIIAYTKEYMVQNKLLEKTTRYNEKHFINLYIKLESIIYNLFKNEELEQNLIKDINNPKVIKTIKFFRSWESAYSYMDNLKVVENNDIQKDTIEKNITLNNVILTNNNKKSIVQLINFINKKEAYDKIGAKMPKGILLYGPPGTGKTLIAKTIAEQTKSSFFNMSGSEFIEKYAGVGAKRVRTLFEKARREAPSIIFIDEIDAIGCKRESEINKENNQTLNQLLVELDGFKKDENIIIIGATNRLDILDNALIRPGRFDRKILIDIPDKENRLKLFKLYCKEIKTDNNIDYDLLSVITEGLTGADIANVCNEAAIHAVDNNMDYITQTDIEFILENNNYNINKPQKNIGFI